MELTYASSLKLDRHVKLVERTIGNKRGTGSSRGVAFLKMSVFQPVFPNLWTIRHRL
jgi:tryptophan 2,3-dioxygenase